MSFRLPPLSALRFFEAAGRHQSFKAAAAELNVTASAISHGIVALERALGVELFIRAPRGLSLTPAGTDYLRYITEALSLIAIGTGRLPSASAHRTIAVSCAPTIASRWLLPRLEAYSRQWPKVSVTIDTSSRHVSFPGDGFDFAIRMSSGAAAKPTWRKLFGERLLPLCSPTYAEKLLDESGRIDLRRATLIHVAPASEDWEAWLSRAGIGGVDPARGLRFDTVELAFGAATRGLGVAVGRRPLVDPELASGALVEIGLEAIVAETAYWLVRSDLADHHPELRAFGRWLLSEASEFEGALRARTAVANEASAVA